MEKRVMLCMKGINLVKKCIISTGCIKQASTVFQIYVMREKNGDFVVILPH
jgi:hypothetical protein